MSPNRRAAPALTAVVKADRFLPASFGWGGSIMIGFQNRSAPPGDHMYTMYTLKLFLVTLLISGRHADLQIAAQSELASTRQAITKEEFIFESAPFPSCHASTLVETKEGIVAAWFAGTRERNPDVGIWISRHDRKGWSPVVEVASGLQENGERFPCWNPVLFQPRRGPLLLFYKVGPSPSRWWGMLTTSTDGGHTWSKPRRLPDGILGPIKNKPVQLKDGTLLCGSSTEHAGWQVHMEMTDDFVTTWNKTEALNDTKEFAAIQPAILVHPSGKIQILCRSEQKRITESWSFDGGRTWTAMQATTLPNPNSGIDAVMLTRGRALLVYNHTEKGRSPLNVAISEDGKTWQSALVLEDQPGEYSYPAVIQTADGLVHITYTWKRVRIKHVVLDPRKLLRGALPASRQAE
jgi:predicted neuraminidase